MLLTKSRTQVLTFGIILLVLGLTILQLAHRVSASNAVGAIPGAFGDNAGLKDPIGWSYTPQGTDVRVNLYLDNLWTGKVFGLEVFIDPAANNPMSCVNG